MRCSGGVWRPRKEKGGAHCEGGKGATRSVWFGRVARRRRKTDRARGRAEEEGVAPRFAVVRGQRLCLRLKEKGSEACTSLPCMALSSLHGNNQRPLPLSRDECLYLRVIAFECCRFSAVDCDAVARQDMTLASRKILVEDDAKDFVVSISVAVKGCCYHQVI